MSADSVERAAMAAANQLGYDNFRDLQLEVVKGVVSGQDMYLLFCQQVMVKACAMPVCCI